MGSKDLKVEEMGVPAKSASDPNEKASSEAQAPECLDTISCGKKSLRLRACLFGSLSCLLGDGFLLHHGLHRHRDFAA